jgi:hypothetical protein
MEGLEQLLTGNLLVLELMDASLCSGTDTSSGQGRIRTAPTVGTFWFWSSGMPQVQTQPVVREGLEHLLTGNLLVLKLMYLELMDATHCL